MLHTVTITGLDESTDMSRVRSIQQEFPFVEWGVLLSESKAGKSPRYPSERWIDKIGSDLRLSGHLCGSWARDAVDNNQTFLKEHLYWSGLFKRIQLNVGGYFDKIQDDKLYAAVDAFKEQTLIIQVGNLDWSVLLGPILSKINILFDWSGGKGVLPSLWPLPIYKWREFEIKLTNCGYAGGLNPGNLGGQLEVLRKLETPIWIDVESGVRTDDLLDLNKVVEFLTIAKEFRI